MAVLLFTDFGASDLYVGQVERRIASEAPGVRVIGLLNEAPAFDVRASAHLLAALAPRIPAGDVVFAVVDPGVGTARRGVVARIDDRYFVAPDNGLLGVVWERGTAREAWRIVPPEDGVSVSFHGRDVFAPVAAALARAKVPEGMLQRVDAPEVSIDGGDLAEVIYVDHYGNVFTGLRAADGDTSRQLVAGGCRIPHARVFGDAPPDQAFWYVNSLGLAEVAIPGAHAAVRLGLSVGQPVHWGR
ncbi:MAG: hypothetical protein GC151_11135 [Betaproteobacteria bacterium]|nr:hypothetical protein [Betaproteobacteria bacterium]